MDDAKAPKLLPVCGSCCHHWALPIHRRSSGIYSLTLLVDVDLPMYSSPVPPLGSWGFNVTARLAAVICFLGRCLPNICTQSNPLPFQTLDQHLKTIMHETTEPRPCDTDLFACECTLQFNLVLDVELQEGSFYPTEHSTPSKPDSPMIHFVTLSLRFTSNLTPCCSTSWNPSEDALIRRDISNARSDLARTSLMNSSPWVQSSLHDTCHVSDRFILWVSDLSHCPSQAATSAHSHPHYPFLAGT